MERVEGEKGGEGKEVKIRELWKEVNNFWWIYFAIHGIFKVRHQCTWTFSTTNQKSCNRCQTSCSFEAKQLVIIINLSTILRNLLNIFKFSIHSNYMFLLKNNNALTIWLWDELKLNIIVLIRDARLYVSTLISKSF